ncbi:hypothetical protein [Profundibacter sp.]
MRYVSVFWLFAAVGAVISILGSKYAHSVAGIPPGVPLARLGIEGKITQISLMILPFIIAPILTGCMYYLKLQRPPNGTETRSITAKIIYSTVALSILFWIGSGAWFGLLQATPLMIFAILTVPIAGVAFIFWLLFPTTAKILACITKKIPNKSSN